MECRPCSLPNPIAATVSVPILEDLSQQESRSPLVPLPFVAATTGLKERNLQSQSMKVARHVIVRLKDRGALQWLKAKHAVASRASSATLVSLHTAEMALRACGLPEVGKALAGLARSPRRHLQQPQQAQALPGSQPPGQAVAAAAGAAGHSTAPAPPSFPIGVPFPTKADHPQVG